MALVKVLGSSSGIATANRFHSSVLIKSNNKLYLFDCGEPVSSLLVRNGFNPAKVEKIFISHMHIDHLGGLPQLIQYMQITRREEQLHIYMPQEGLKVFQEFLQSVYLFKEIMAFDLSLHSIDELENNATGGFSVIAVPNTHLQSLAQFGAEYGYVNKGESYSFIAALKEDDRVIRIAYTGDIANCSELDVLLQSRVELLITEFAHFSIEQFAAKNDLLKNAGKILLTHIGPALNDSIQEQLNDNVPDELKNKIIIATDGVEVLV